MVVVDVGAAAGAVGGAGGGGLGVKDGELKGVSSPSFWFGGLFAELEWMGG